MGGYADYALATRVPALWAQMQRDQAQKRTGDLAKNMFAQLQGLDPQSKEYFQRMRQLGMESGDDTLYQTGEGLNKAQQGYVFDDPMLTGHWKDFLLEGGDPNDKNAFAVWNDRRASQSGTKVNIAMPGQPGFDWDSPIPFAEWKELNTGINGANLPYGSSYRMARDLNVSPNPPSDTQLKSGGDSVNLGASIDELIADTEEYNRLPNKGTVDSAYQAAKIAQGGGGYVGAAGNYGMHKLPAVIQRLDNKRNIVAQNVTKMLSGTGSSDVEQSRVIESWTPSPGEDKSVTDRKILNLKRYKKITEIMSASKQIPVRKGKYVMFQGYRDDLGEAKRLKLNLETGNVEIDNLD
jgi:hypothetical protein